MYSDKAAGEYIRGVREAKGYKQDYVAHKLNLSQNAYSKTELGKSNLTVGKLFALSDILEFDVSDMIKFLQAKKL
ncbi:helix-turn-helix domain-containing protein [Mucilaginibacter jinjuensis]|uniref:helix-turn-helix domain-containing protein n=1 Tax=Mucilaginibacter jinjuensis TaxID=1176721 RepID=UPI003B5877F7